MANCFQRYEVDLWDDHHRTFGTLVGFPQRHCTRCEDAREALEADGWTLDAAGLAWKRPAPDTRTACPVCGGAWKNVAPTASGWGETVCKACFAWALDLFLADPKKLREEYADYYRGHQYMLELQFNYGANQPSWVPRDLVEKMRARGLLRDLPPPLPCSPGEVTRWQDNREALNKSAGLLNCAVGEIPDRIRKIQASISAAKKERVAFKLEFHRSGRGHWVAIEVPWYDGPDLFIGLEESDG